MRRILIVSITIIGMFFLMGCGSQSVGTITEISQPEVLVTPVVSQIPMTPVPEECWVVHVCGAVQSPGVYSLQPGARVEEAIQMAGGFSATASKSFWNLAAEVSDGMQILVPTWEEVDSGKAIPSTGGQKVSAEETEGALVNLNTATAEELMTLPGIGEQKADTILSYREEHGPFQAIEELKNISGIKDGVFEKIKTKITV